MTIPAVSALVTLFAAFVLISGSAIVIAGFLPPPRRGEAGGSAGRTAVTVLACVTLIVWCVTLLFWAYATLPVSWAIVAGGLGILTGPLAFQALPARLTESPVALIAIAAVNMTGSAIMLDRIGT